MANYPPPSENLPIFDALVFLTPLNATLTAAEADAKYLARQDVAVSVAQTTSFTDNITIGNSLLDYIPLQGLQIKPTVNSEAVFLRVLDGAGATKQRIECNQTHTHLYDQTRLTDTADVTNYTSLQQTGATLDIADNSTSGAINLRTKGTGGIYSTPVAITSTSVTLAPSQSATVLCGVVCNSAIFGRNDTTANIFYGTLGYTRHPIGWTIKASKAVSSWTTAVGFDVIAVGTATTEFTTLSNGVWKFGCCYNNTAGLGSTAYLVSSWGTPTGATILNGTPASVSPYNQVNCLMFETTVGLSNFGTVMPEMIIQVTGNRVTNIELLVYSQYTVQPTYTFNMWATKIG